ncbi:MAG: hypothetical protein JHC96_05490 [Brevundimonas sp.]|uniref:hypothetical protein n=1 Tax=Brevundimonas sp. TaxID=1871086 RepID=UPI001A227A2A|nr:hypothetical protein [Brevundimonas sp.]MBJ7318231.1 hypothetical protein [Brevundimonas sp.]
MGLAIILVECDVTSPEGVTATLRFSDRAVFPMAPTDAQRPNAVWDERIIETPSLRRTLFDDLQTLEPGLGVGDLTLANADRALDAYQGHVWGEVRVWRWIYGAPFAEAASLMRGPASGAPAYDVSAARPGRARLTLFDYRIELERPLQTNTYAGTNNGTTILYEGEAALEGAPKPLAFGELLNAHLPGVVVNAGQQAFQIHDGPVQTFPTVPALIMNDRGFSAGLHYDGEAASLAAFSTTNPTVDGQTTYAPLGLTRFNFNPVGNVSFSAFGDASDGGYSDKPGPILRKLLKRAGIAEARIGASVAALASNRTVGVYVQDATKSRDLIAFVARSALAAVLPGRDGVWQAVAIKPPKAIADVTLNLDDVLGIEADESAADGAGEFRVGHSRIWTTFRRESLLPALRGTAEEKALAASYRYFVVEDAAFKARFAQTWRTLTVETALRRSGEAEDLAGDLKALFGLRADGRPRRRWRVTVEMTDAALAFDLGATVALATPAVGGDGRFLLIGEELMRPRRDQMIWTLWG